MSLLSIARYFCKYMVYKSRRAALLLTKSRVFFWFGMVILALNLIFLMALHFPSPPLFINIVCKYTRRLAMCCCFLVISSHSYPVHHCNCFVYVPSVSSSLADALYYFFTAIYILETILKLYGKGLHAYFTSYTLIYEFVVS